ncbi:unnamed protein product [Adineta steineri]|uniref:SH3 domain-binding protein 5-like protein n=1 Tax=Adineta steineri TaxID=433720 RepID=A0A814TCW1_9BILA|nr:unnamed protein product [Adineta steineri]CAF1002344.1 unnamed protein product [Adineta steineri]CAF1023328.1 unnamed protein product [Adineta steineri]CAF1159109.1 unnamed protein product [Adineta steineri]CAF3752476.1 unnamed protein product [Adineta steineri]
MSDSSKTVDSDDESLDPRIQIELERANAATSEINNLETQLDNAQKLFQLSFTNCKQRLANYAQTLGRCVERARPYYNACKQAEEAQIETQKAAQEYQNSVELYYTAKENLTLAGSKLPEEDNITRQEYINHITIKVTQTEQDKIHCEQIHEEKSKRYQEYEQQRLSLSRSLTRTIMKSKPYFDAKLKAENELKNQKLRIEDVQKAISQAKKTYRAALNNLEQISEEIHMKRKNQISIKLPPREPGVGAEHPDEFIELPNFELTEFPKTDLSDESSDNEASTNCMHTSSNIDISKTLSPITTNKSKTHLSTQTIACSNTKHDQRRQKIGKIKPTRMIMNNETPLLSHLCGTHKFHSDSNLNLITKQ